MENKKIEAGIIIEQIIKGNRNFVQSRDNKYFEEFQNHQNPLITMVSCSDSRVQPNVIFPDATNKIFLVENVGNQILASEGSVDYGVFHLKTPILLILGHSDCGAIKAYMKGFSNEIDSIKHILEFFNQVDLESGDVFDNDIVVNNILKNVDYQIDIALKKYHDLIQNKELLVIGAYYDFKNDISSQLGDLVFVNVNGEKNIDKIKQLALFKNLTGVEKDKFVKRRAEYLIA